MESVNIETVEDLDSLLDRLSRTIAKQYGLDGVFIAAYRRDLSDHLSGAFNAPDINDCRAILWPETISHPENLPTAITQLREGLKAIVVAKRKNGINEKAIVVVKRKNGINER